MVEQNTGLLSTGIGGLDEILGGGIEPGNAYLVSGVAGTGKTILGLHFLATGIARGERVLYITLQESQSRLISHARRVGIDIANVDFLDLSPPAEFFSMAKSYDIFSPAEVERGPVAHAITESIERLKPTRILVDPLSQIRFLALNAFHFRKQVLSFLKFVSKYQAAVLLASEPITDMGDDDMQVIVDGIVQLGHADRARSLRIQKTRGRSFWEGNHAFRISNTGMTVYPNTLPPYKREYLREQISSGNPYLDKLLGGGIERGTVTLVSGPSGVGKTTFGMQFMKAAAARDERCVVFALEEDPDIILRRCEAIRIPARDMVKNHMLEIHRIDPAQFLPHAFSAQVRHEVELMGARWIMVDSITAYARHLNNESDAAKHMETLRDYLKGCGANLFLISEIASAFEVTCISNLQLSAIADNIIFIRYIEMRGEIRKVIAVLKKRLSDFQKTLHDFAITGNGINIGQPLTEVRGILRGEPEEIR